MFKNFIKTALRNIRRQKTFSIINISGLAIGLAACLVISMWIGYHLSFERSQPAREQIVRPILDINIDGITPMQHCGSFAWTGPLVANACPEVIEFVRLYQENKKFHIRFQEKELTAYQIFYADASLFTVFNIELKYGTTENALTEPNSIVLNSEYAEKIFGNENPIGRMIEIDRQPLKITAVLAEPPANTHLRFPLIKTFDQHWLIDQMQSRTTKYDPNFFTYYKLAPGADLAKLHAETAAIMSDNLPQFAGKVKVFYQTLADMHLHSKNFEFDHINWRKVDINYIYIFAAIAFLILFIAAINFINLTTACSLRRTKEVGIRKTVGAHRHMLIMQFIGESVLISLLAMLIAIALVEILKPFLGPLFGYDLQFIVSNRLLLYVSAGLLAVLTGLLSGIYPAFFLSKPEPQAVLKSTGLKGKSGFKLKWVLVVLQLSISLVLIICSAMIGKQVQWMQNQDLGWSREHILSFPMPEPIRDNYESIRHELLSYSDVQDVSAVGPVDFPGLQGKQFHYENQPPDQIWLTSCMAVDYNFIDMFSITLLDGRAFSKEMSTDTGQAYIINETLQKRLGWKNPVGKKFIIPDHLDQWGTVIGVVKDFKYESLHHKVDGVALFIKPEIYSNLSIKTAQYNPHLLEQIKGKWTAYAPKYPFEYYSLNNFYKRAYDSEKNTQILLVTFAGIAIFIACLGLLGLVAYSAQQRTKEIGIRKTLGASVNHIFYLLTREFLLLFSISILLASPLAWYFSRQWLNNFAYHTGIGFNTFLLSWIILWVIGFSAISWQVIRAVRTEPVKVLRYE